MKIERYKKYLHTPFSVSSEQVENQPGTWNSTKISVYRDDTLIGEYLRNYSNYGLETFYPFRLGGEWYALYSPHYTSTRVMKLYEDRIEDWCGEDASSNGFCPTEFYIPKYVQTKQLLPSQLGDSEYSYYTVDCGSDAENFAEEFKVTGKVDYCNFGFLSGCVWGDDSCWKLRHIDLSKVPEKILVITDKLGYWQLPDDTLKNNIGMDNWEPGVGWITIKRQEHVNLYTNERC